MTQLQHNLYLWIKTICDTLLTYIRPPVSTGAHHIYISNANARNLVNLNASLRRQEAVIFIVKRCSIIRFVDGIPVNLDIYEAV